jgi:hypothetical protein
MNRNSSLVILSLTHLVSGGVLGWFAEDGPASNLLAVYIGLFFSQTSLLGIWAGFARLSWRLRLVGFVLGIGYLLPQFCFSLDDWNFELHVLVILSASLVASAMIFVRRFYATLDFDAAQSHPIKAEGLQFSILHLMLLTGIVGCLLAIGQWLQPYFRASNQMMLIVTIGLCFVSVGITSVWAMLGSGRTLIRSVIVLAISLLTSLIPSYCIDGGELWFWGVMMTAEATVLLVSLFVVRRIGYRLVRLSRGPE